MCSAKWITSWTPSNYQVETKTKASTKFRRECHACICRKGGIVVFSRWWTQWQRAHLDDRGIDDRVCRQRASRQAGSHRACGGDALRDERHSTPAYRTAVHTVLWCCCCHSRDLLQTHSSLCWQTQIYWKPLSGASSLLRLLKGNYLDFTNLLIRKESPIICTCICTYINFSSLSGKIEFPQFWVILTKSFALLYIPTNIAFAFIISNLQFSCAKEKACFS